MAPMARGKHLAGRSLAPVLFALALPLLALPAAGQKKREERSSAPPPPVRCAAWLSDLDAARTAALERNAPIVILALLEGETTSDRVRNELYNGAEFAQATAGTVFIVMNLGDHPPKTIDVVTESGETVQRTVCSVYETPTCADHKRNWKSIYQEYHVNGEMRLPHLLVLLPDGRIHGRCMDEIQRGAALKLVQEAKAAAGPSLSEKDLVEVKGQLDQLRSFEATGRFAEAWHAAARVLELTSTGAFADKARAAEERALLALRGKLKEALAKLEQGSVEQGYVSLRGLAQGMVGTPLEGESAELLKKTEKDKRWKETIAEVQRKEEAEKLWTDCLAALDEGKTEAAERLAGRILKRFAGTPAATKAAQRFPALSGEDPAGK
jgi:hypothetical protein